MKQILRFLFVVMLTLCCVSQGIAQQPSVAIIIDSTKSELRSDNPISNPGLKEGVADRTDATVSATPLHTSDFTTVETGKLNDPLYLIATNVQIQIIHPIRLFNNKKSSSPSKKELEDFLFATNLIAGKRQTTG